MERVLNIDVMNKLWLLVSKLLAIKFKDQDGDGS